MFKENTIPGGKSTVRLSIIFVSAACLLSGCAQLADPELSSIKSAERDQMVGIYITVDKDSDSYWDDWGQYEGLDGKIYAEKVEESNDSINVSRFPVEGFPCYLELNTEENADGTTYHSSRSNTADVFWGCDTCTNVYSTGSWDDLTDSDMREYNSYSITAVFHAVYDDFWGDTEDPYFMINKVYREPDGDYYMVSGDCFSAARTEEGECSLGTVSISESWTASGYDKELTSTFTFSCEYYAHPTETQVLQYSSDDQLLKTDCWAAGQAPSTLKTESETSYLIIKNIGQNEDGSESVSTTTSSPELGADTTYVDDWYEAEDGTVLWNQIEVSW